MFDKRTKCYEVKCRRIGNQQKNIIQIIIRYEKYLTDKFLELL